MDINKASAEELQHAFEVDGERARYIIDKRTELGGFENWQQIKEVVPSIDDKMVENLRAAGITMRRSESPSEKPQPTSERDGRSRSVNELSREQLEEVCQIDGERADYFLQKRRELGGFRSWEQIKNTVPSFDDGMVRRLRNAGFTVASEDSEAA